MSSARVVTANVKKTDIIEFLDDRLEKEVVVNPNSINIIGKTELLGIEFLEDILTADVINTYHSYRDMMCSQLQFKTDSVAHGKAHSARVLMLTLILAKMMGLQDSDKKILATAAIFHDTQRNNDDVDCSHGAEACKYYKNQEKKPNPKVEFLLEYHCLPDECGQSAIKENKLNSNTKRMTLLYNIFKDADALDRIRFGIKNLDINQLRLEESTKLVLIAKILLEDIKI